MGRANLSVKNKPTDNVLYFKLPKRITAKAVLDILFELEFLFKEKFNIVKLKKKLLFSKIFLAFLY